MQEIRENVPLAPFTTFQIGGPARYFVDVRSDQEIMDAIAWAKERRVKHVILSGGSNVLIPDEGLGALVIHMVGNLYSRAGNTLDTWAGTNLLFLIQTCGRMGLGGWEKLAGIPGTIGGAVRGNAGAFGPEIKDFVATVRALNATTGEMREFSTAECDFSYRHSFFKDNSEWIVVRTVLNLTAVDPAASAQLAQNTVIEREKRHLQNVKAAGSFFMNPVAPANVVAMFEEEKNVKSRENRVPAGWLIEKAGLKGFKIGGAMASVQHPNYLVNAESASAKDVLAVAAKIKETVKEKFDIELKEEAAILGTVLSSAAASSYK